MLDIGFDKLFSFDIMKIVIVFGFRTIRQREPSNNSPLQLDGSAESFILTIYASG